MKNFENKKIAGIILCAGSGTRTNLPYNKILHFVGKKTVIELTVEKFAPNVTQLICVCREADLYNIQAVLAQYDNITYCIGGKTRTESVRCGLNEVEPDTDVVVIHDGVRPFVKDILIKSSIKSALEYGSGISAVKSIDAIKIKDGQKLKSLDKSKLYNIQTPQAFNFTKLVEAYNKADGDDYSDDSEVYESNGNKLALIEGDYANTKITTTEDLWKISSQNLKIGVGVDAHKYVPNRKLILGGIAVPHTHGLAGHSDADVLLHAIMDAILSACGMHDIGMLFPDTDKTYLNINSKYLLEKVVALISNKMYTVKNISAVIIAQEPKLSPHILSMRENIALLVNLTIDNVNISATTTEHMGFIGEGLGVAVSCTCLVEKRG